MNDDLKCNFIYNLNKNRVEYKLTIQILHLENVIKIF